MSRSMNRALAPVVLALVVGLSACSTQPAGFGGEESPTDPTTEATSEVTEPADQGGGNAQNGGDAQDGDADADPQTVDAGDVIAETTYPLSGSNEGSTVTVGVHSLTVDGATMRLELYFTPNGAGAESEGAWSLHEMGGPNYIQPVLNDRENLKQYLVLTDGPGANEDWSTLSSPSSPPITSGETAVWWGYFAAPEDDIDLISVGVIPGAVEFDSIPIER